MNFFSSKRSKSSKAATKDTKADTMDSQGKNVRSSSLKSKKSSASGYSTGKEELAGGDPGQHLDASFNYDLNDRQPNARLSLPVDLRG